MLQGPQGEEIYKHMLTVEVNHIKIDIVDRRVLQEVEPHWIPLANSNWWIRLPDNNYDFLQAAGHNIDQIDLAVPQQWFEKYKKVHGEYPKACWTYEDNSIFGNPLFYKDVLPNFEKAVMKAIEAAGYPLMTYS